MVGLVLAQILKRPRSSSRSWRRFSVSWILGSLREKKKQKSVRIRVNPWLRFLPKSAMN